MTCNHNGNLLGQNVSSGRGLKNSKTISQKNRFTSNLVSNVQQVSETDKERRRP